MRALHSRLFKHEATALPVAPRLPSQNGRVRKLWIALVVFVVASVSGAQGAPRARPAPRPHVTRTPQPHVSAPAPKPPTDLRRRNSIVMDVDFEEAASLVNNDVIDITGTMQLILDRIAAATAPANDFGQVRPIVWVPLTGDKECHDATDAGILEVRVARFVSRTRNFIIIGHQVEEANLAFRLYDCAGRELLRFPVDPSSSYAESRFAPYYLSITGSVAVVALANAHSNNASIAETIGVFNGYYPLQANIGAHDSNALRLLALHRMMGNIPGKDVPPPGPGTVAELLQTCGFAGDADNVIRLHCAPQASPSPSADGSP
jgi:hypothetical protein